MKGLLVGLLVLGSFSSFASCHEALPSFLNSEDTQAKIKDTIERFKEKAESKLLDEGFERVEFNIASLPLLLNKASVEDINLVNGYTHRKLKVNAYRKGKVFKSDGTMLIQKRRIKRTNIYGETISDECALDVNVIGGSITNKDGQVISKLPHLNISEVVDR